MTTGNLKSLGLALAAVFAMSVMAAPAAHATNAQFTYGAGATDIDGEQIGVHKFISSGRTLECDIATFTGHKGATSTTMTVTPEYRDCQTTSAVGTFPATVTPNGCDFLFHGIETPGKTEAEGKWEATADVVCAGPNVITVDVYTSGTKTMHSGIMCTKTIGVQNGLATIKGTNKAAIPPNTWDYIEADISITGITVTHHIEPGHSAVLCGASNNTAKYEGTATLRATNAVNEFVNLTISSD